MIDFRYHLVSIVAVFLALAAGIVLGAVALTGPVKSGLTGDVDELRGDKQALEGQVQRLRVQTAADDRFAARVGPQVVSGVLADKKVLLVVGPGAPELADAVEPMLTQAGATLTGRLQVLPTLADPASRALLEDLVAQAVPPGLELPEGEPVDQASAELAAALTTPPGGKGIADADAQSVVAAYEQADMVRLEPAGDALSRADVVLVLGGSDAGADGQDAALLALAAALDNSSSGVVVGSAGAADSPGDLVRALREDSAVAAAVSGVDSAGRGTGTISTVLALAEQVRGETGQYGVGAEATALLPAPAG